MLRVLLFLFLLSGQLSAMIIPANRVTTWQGNVGVQGGIPNRTTQHGPTLANTSTSAQINSAIASCPSGSFVKLGTGTFNVSGTIILNKSNVTLRGSGRSATTINTTNGSIGIDMFGSYLFNPNPITNWTAGYAQGTVQITVASSSGFAVGDLIALDQLNDSAYVGGGDEGPTALGNDGSGGHLQMMLTEIKAINGNLITIEPGLYMRNWSGSFSPRAMRYVNSKIVYTGIEDLSIIGYVNGSSSYKVISLFGCQNCWFKNISITNGYYSQIYIAVSKKIEVRDSYFKPIAVSGIPGTYSLLSILNSNLLIENNIWRGDSIAGVGPILLQHGTCGSVVGYNYFEHLAAQACGNWMGYTVVNHNAHPNYNLYEGNVTPQITADYIHGSSSEQTFLRNVVRGRDWIDMPAPNTGPGCSGPPNSTSPQMNSNAIHLQSHQRYYNIVGNIIGTTGWNAPYAAPIPSGGNWGEKAVYRLGFVGSYNGTNDSLVSSTLIRHGNWDNVNNAVLWETNNNNVVDFNDRNIPNSYYLSSAPSWFGGLTWPPFSSSSPSNNQITRIPAGYYYTNGVWPGGGGDPAPVLNSISPNPLIGSDSNVTFTAFGSNFATTSKIQISKLSNPGFVDQVTVYGGPASLSVTLLVPNQNDTWLFRILNADSQISDQVTVNISNSAPPEASIEVAGQRVTSDANGGAGSAFKAFPLPVTAGNILVVAGGVCESPAPVSVSVTDSRGTSYVTTLGGVMESLFRTFISIGVAPSTGPCTVTVNPDGATGDFSWSQDEFNGALATNMISARNSTEVQFNAGASGSATGAITPFANALIIAVMTHGGNNLNLSAGTDFTMIGKNEVNGNNQAHLMEFRVVNSSQTYPVTVGHSASPWTTYRGMQSVALGDAKWAPPTTLLPPGQPRTVGGAESRITSTTYQLEPTVIDSTTTEATLVPDSASIEGGGVATTLLSASIGQDGNFLTLTFNKNIASGVDGASTGLAITTDGDATVATYSEGEGASSLVYSLSDTVLAVDTLTLDYVQPGDGLKSGSEVASFTGLSVYNGSFVDLTAPTITSATVSEDGVRIILLFSQAVTTPGEGMATGFTLTSDGDPQTMEYLYGAGDASITYTLSGTVLEGDELTLDYDSVAGDVQDISGNALAAIVDEPVTNGAGATTSPLLTSATVDATGDVFTLVFNGAVVAGADGFSDGFAITTDGAATVATYVSGTGTATLVYSLSATVMDADVLTLDYVQPGDGVQDAAENVVASFAAQAVVNNSTEI